MKLRRLAGKIWMVLPPGIATIFLVGVILSATGCSALRPAPLVTPTALRTAIPTGRHTPWPSPTYRPAPPSITPTVLPASPLVPTLASTWTISFTSTLTWTAPLPGVSALPLTATLALSETLPGLQATGALAVVLLTETGTPAGETAAVEGTVTPQQTLAITDPGTPLAEAVISATAQTTVMFSVTLATPAGFSAAQPLTSTSMPAGLVGTPLPMIPTAIIWRVTAVAGLAPTPIASPSITPSPTVTPTSTPEPDPGLCIPAGQPVYGVARWVIDGGTLQVEFNGVRRNVRLLGIAVPVILPPSEYMGPVAKDRLTKLAQGRVVRMVSDPLVDHDENGLLLRYVSVEDGPFLNFSLLRQGLARSLLQPPGLACETTFIGAEADAQAEMLGIWGP